MVAPTEATGAASQLDDPGPSGKQVPGGQNQRAAGPVVQTAAMAAQDLPGSGTVPVQLVDDRGDIELLTRFLMGLLLTAPDLVMARIRDVRAELAMHPEFVTSPQSLSQASAGELARYLAIGLTIRGQDRLLKGARRGAQISLGTASWTLGFLDRATDGWLMRPIRRPVETRLRRFARRTGQVIREGQLEEQKGRLLAQEAAYGIMDDLIEFVAENPEAAAWIREVIGGQGVSLATAMRDNARQLSVASDGHAEAIVRRILRRPPRKALPESPMTGKSQTMYNPATAAQGVAGYEQLDSETE